MIHRCWMILVLPLVILIGLILGPLIGIGIVWDVFIRKW